MNVTAMIRAKYARLSDDQKKIAIVSAAFFCFFLLYLIVHGCHTMYLNRCKVPVPPLMIRHGNEIQIPLGSPLRAQMTIETVQSSSLPHTLSFPGMVEANPLFMVAVLPPLTGRLMSLDVSLGDSVKKDQVLAVISSPDLAQAYSDRDKAASAMKLASDILKRAKEVLRVGGNSMQEVQQAENAFIQAQSEFQRADARLKTLGNNRFSSLSIRSPINGRVTSINYGVGSYITDLTASILTISDINSVWVTANVPENLVGVIKKNQLVDVTLAAYPNQVLHGKVSFVNSFIEPDSRRNKTRIVFSNLDGKLQPNMFATVKVEVKQPSQVMIPISSILMNNETTSVYVESKPWICQRREVRLGTEDGEQVRVLSGLKVGERIVTCGGVFIND